MLTEKEQWEHRKAEYRHFLKDLPAYEYALAKSLSELSDFDAKKSGHARKYDEIFLHVFAPAVTSYVNWVLEEALRRGTRRLYFLSRDGWLMKFAAELLAKKIDNPPEIRYLKVSRYSLRRAEYLISGKKCLDVICVGGIDITFRKIMLRAALTEEEIYRIARLAGFESKIDLPLNYSQILGLKDTLKDVDLFFEYVSEHAKECFEETIGYLRQEGLMDESFFAVVDSGWIGTTQQSLNHLIQEGGSSAQGYYFGIYEIPKDCNPLDYHGFYIDGSQRFFQNIARKTNFAVCLFEAVISSPEGMTLGYKRDGDRFLAYDSTVCNPNHEYLKRNRELLEIYLKHFLDFRENQGSFEGLTNPEREGRMLSRIFRKAMGHPTAWEAKILGEFQFCDDVLEHHLKNVASVMDHEELKKQKLINRILIKLNLKKEILHESGWPEGSFVNAGSAKLIPQEHSYKFLMYLRKNIKCQRRNVKKIKQSQIRKKDPDTSSLP